MKKNVKLIIEIISAVIIAAAAVAAIIIYREKIMEAIGTIKEKFCGDGTNKTRYTAEEFEDFADI